MSGTTRLKATTKQNARSLRREMTDAEKLLWRNLRLKQFAGYKFRRQHPIGNYIVDFVCLEAALILEVDGGQHADHSDSDAIRTQWLETKGFRVMRFWNNEMLNNIEGVKLVIWNYLSGIQPPSVRSGRSASCGNRTAYPSRVQPSGGTTSHSTKRANNARQVAGYPCQGEGVDQWHEDK